MSFEGFALFKSHLQTSTANEIGGSYEINTVPSMIQPPIEQYMSFLSGCLDSPTIPDSKQKRKAPDDVNRDQERKKEADRAYRQRCKVSNMLLSMITCLLVFGRRRFVLLLYIFIIGTSL
jgi:hypothetical protein